LDWTEAARRGNEESAVGGRGIIGVMQVLPAAYRPIFDDPESLGIVQALPHRCQVSLRQTYQDVSVNSLALGYDAWIVLSVHRDVVKSARRVDDNISRDGHGKECLNLNNMNGIDRIWYI
jgi:hypothetical protein